MNGGFLAIAGGAMARRWRWMREREEVVAAAFGLEWLSARNAAVWYTKHKFSKSHTGVRKTTE